MLESDENNSYSKGMMSGQILIPKIPCSTKLSHFSSISQCNMVHKIIAKALFID